MTSLPMREQRPRISVINPRDCPGWNPAFDLSGYVMRDNDEPLVVNMDSEYGPLIHRGTCYGRHSWLADCPSITEEELAGLWATRYLIRLGFPTPVPGFCGPCVILRISGPTVAAQVAP